MQEERKCADPENDEGHRIADQSALWLSLLDQYRDKIYVGILSWRKLGFLFSPVPLAEDTQAVLPISSYPLWRLKMDVALASSKRGAEHQSQDFYETQQNDPLSCTLRKDQKSRRDYSTMAHSLHLRDSLPPHCHWPNFRQRPNKNVLAPVWK